MKIRIPIKFLFRFSSLTLKLSDLICIVTLMNHNNYTLAYGSFSEEVCKAEISNSFILRQGFFLNLVER